MSNLLSLLFILLALATSLEGDLSVFSSRSKSTSGFDWKSVEGDEGSLLKMFMERNRASICRISTSSAVSGFVEGAGPMMSSNGPGCMENTAEEITGRVRAWQPPIAGREIAFLSTGEGVSTKEASPVLFARRNSLWTLYCGWTSLFPGRSSYCPWRKDMSPKASLSPPLPMWMVWRKSPRGGLIISGDKISLRRHFFPFLLLVGLRYIGAFAGMAVSKAEISDMQVRTVGSPL